MLIILLIVGSIVSCEAFLGNSLPENQWAREVFHLVDSNNSSSLSITEVQNLYSSFDNNEDGTADFGEFMKHWVESGIGPAAEGVKMFMNLDTDHNGKLSNNPDLQRTYTYFDTDGDGVVTISEFVISWIKLSSS